MTDAYLDGLLDNLVNAEPRERWDDVLGRARRSRRRYALGAAVVTALVLVPATWAAVNAFEGTPAPHSIHQTFLQGDAAAAAIQAEIAQAGIERAVPRADASKAHGVLQLRTSDGPLDMWAAPELNGNGSCWFVGWESDLRADSPGGFGSCAPINGSPISATTFNDAHHPAYMVVAGSVTGPEPNLDVTLTDGSTTKLPVVEHLFLSALPHGSKVASIVARDAGGNVVATWPPSS